MCLEKNELRMKVPHTLYKGTHEWDTTTICMSWALFPLILDPIHLIHFTWLREGPLGSSPWPRARSTQYPIGHLFNPLIFKLDKSHSVFELLIVWYSDLWCTCLDCLFIDWIHLSWCYDLTSLAWDSMGLQAHMLDAKGSHEGWERLDL